VEKKPANSNLNRHKPEIEKPRKSSKSDDSDIILKEIAGKLDALADRVDQLTQIVLENRRTLETLRAAEIPRPTDKNDQYPPGYGRYDNYLGENKSNFTESPPGALLPERPEVLLISQTETDEMEIEGTVSREERIRQYEEKNPW
jgi:hypothetical protein